MDEMELIKKELDIQISSLEARLTTAKKQKEVLEIIDSLKSVYNSTLGYKTIFFDQNISREGMDEFISLLDSSEYLIGTSTGGNFYSNKGKKEHVYYKYYLTLGQGTLMTLTFRESQYSGYEGISKKITDKMKESAISCKVYKSQEEIYVKLTDGYVDKYKFLSFVKQDGDNIEYGPTCNFSEYMLFNNKKLSEVLTPVSIDNLANRYFDKLHQLNGQKQK